jgi:hypothetical protein
VSKRAARKIDTERFSVKKLNEGDVKEQYQVIITNKFVAMEKRTARTSTGHGTILEKTSKLGPERV